MTANVSKPVRTLQSCSIMVKLHTLNIQSQILSVIFALQQPKDPFLFNLKDTPVISKSPYQTSSERYAYFWMWMIVERI